MKVQVEESRRGTKLIEARFLFIFREEQNENSLVIENFVIEYLCGTETEKSLQYKVKNNIANLESKMKTTLPPDSQNATRKTNQQNLTKYD
jgi:hypothetical protein